MSCFQFPQSSSPTPSVAPVKAPPPASSVTPVKPIYPFLPARLLSSASAPILSPAASVLSPAASVPSVAIPMPSTAGMPNPEYREPWDEYWARTRPNKNRPYDRSHLAVPMPPREKGSCTPVFIRLLEKKNIC